MLIPSLSIILGFISSYCLYYVLIARNPYSTDLYVGKKGAGKTTLMVRLAIKFIEKGWKVFCNVSIPGTYKIRPEDVGVKEFSPDSVIMLDEAGLIWNNRNWKNLGMNVIRFMKMCRHERNKLVLFTQSNNEIDVSFMRICDRLSLVSNWFNIIGKVRHLRYKQVLIPASDMAEARITDDIVTVPLLLGGMTVYWMPAYWKYFDSFDRQVDLETYDFPYTPFPVGVKPVLSKSDAKELKRSKRKFKKQVRRYKRHKFCKKLFSVLKRG